MDDENGMEMGKLSTDDLAFLGKRGLDTTRSFTALERLLMEQIRQALSQAEAVVMRLGGKAGRLGESIVATALLESVLQALRLVGNTGIPVTVIVDEGVVELFDAQCYREAYWPAIDVLAAQATQMLQAEELLTHIPAGCRGLLLDLHGAHDGMPYLARLDGALALMHLARVGIRYYARHGPLRRYADFIQDLFGLKKGELLVGQECQPTLRLSQTDRARYPALAQTFGLRTAGEDADTLRIICFFQSVVVAKCYQRWDEVMQHLPEAVAQRWPTRRLKFLIACGPDEVQPEGLRQADLAAAFADFTGAQGNAAALVRSTPSLRDLAVLVSQAHLALSNDTGPGHLSGALHTPTIVPFLPGGVYAKEVWASTLWHRGITRDPSPFTDQQIEAAVIWDRSDIINSIDPALLAAEALSCLPDSLP